MRDPECVVFLQWALPKLQQRYQGYRKVRGQVSKRIRSRVKTLGLSTLSEYRDCLVRTPAEWEVLRDLSRITISRFYRDHRVFERLGDEVFPELAQGLRPRESLQVWSAGCASGEEPYTLALVLAMSVQAGFPDLSFRILGTDSDEAVLARACAATYGWSSVRELPGPWLDQAFENSKDRYWLRSRFREPVEFRQQDIRREIPEQTFHAISCRNLVFTYFDEALQREILQRLRSKLHPGGALILGIHESLPENAEGFEAWEEALRNYRRTARQAG